MLLAGLCCSGKGSYLIILLLLFLFFYFLGWTTTVNNAHMVNISFDFGTLPHAVNNIFSWKITLNIIVIKFDWLNCWLRGACHVLDDDRSVCAESAAMNTLDTFAVHSDYRPCTWGCWRSSECPSWNLHTTYTRWTSHRSTTHSLHPTPPARNVCMCACMQEVVFHLNMPHARPYTIQFILFTN